MEETSKTTDSVASTPFKEEVPLRKLSKETHLSAEMEISNTETLTPESAFSQSVLNFDDSQAKLDMDVPTENASPPHNRTDLDDDDTLSPLRAANEKALFEKLLKKYKGLEASQKVLLKTSEQISIASSKQSILPNPNNLPTNDKSQDSFVLHQPSYSNYQSLLTSNGSKEIDSCHYFLEKQHIDNSAPGSSGSENFRLVSTEFRARSKSNEVDKKSKSKLHEELKQSRLHKRFQSSELHKKSSKSPSKKECAFIMAQLYKYAGCLKPFKPIKIEQIDYFGMKVPKVTTKDGVFYDTKDSIQYILKTRDHQVASSPTESSDSGTLTPGSDESRSSPDSIAAIETENITIPSEEVVSSDVSESSEVAELSEKTLHKPFGRLYKEDPISKASFEKEKQLDPSVKTNQLDTSVRPKQLNLSGRPKKLHPIWTNLSGPANELKFTYKSYGCCASTSNMEIDFKQLSSELNIEHIILKRRDFILNLRETAARVKAFMDIVILLKKECEVSGEIIQAEQKEYGMKVLQYWNIVKEGLGIMIGNIDIIYNELFDQRILPTSEVFSTFMKQFVCVFRDCLELDQVCRTNLPNRNCYHSRDARAFYDHTESFISHVFFLLQQLREEVDYFEKFRRQQK